MAQDQLHKLLACIFSVHENEIDCQMCNEQLDCLAEKVAAGAQLCELLPAVEAHFNCCIDCREEFEALVAIIRAENSGLLKETTD